MLGALLEILFIGWESLKAPNALGEVLEWQLF